MRFPLCSSTYWVGRNKKFSCLNHQSNNMAQTMQKAQNSRSYAFFRVQLTLKKCSYKKTECSSKWKCIYHGLSNLFFGVLHGMLFYCFISGRLYIFELFSFIFIRVLRPSLRPRNYVWCWRSYSSEHRFSYQRRLLCCLRFLNNPLSWLNHSKLRYQSSLQNPVI